MSNLEDKIESYLLGFLTGSELEEFENELGHNQELANLVQQYRTINKKLEAYRIRTKVKLALSTNSRRRVVLPQKSYIGIAASLLILTLSIWFYISKKDSFENGQIAQEKIITEQQGSDSLGTGNTPVNENEHVAILENQSTENTGEVLIERRKIASLFLVLPMLVQVRESEHLDSAHVESQSERAKAAFSTQNYQEVIRLLDKVTISLNDEELLFIRAISYFKTSMYNKAALDFKMLKQSFQFKAEADFNAMLCLLALNKMDSTKQILNAMISDEDFQFRNEAIAIKAKINFE